MHGSGHSSCFLAADKLSIVISTVFLTIDNKRRVKVCLDIWVGLIYLTLNGLSRLDLSESVLHGSSLHVVKDTILADVSGSHWRWRHVCTVSLGHGDGRLCWESVLLGKGLSGWADESGDWDLLGDWHKRQEVVVKHLIECDTFIDIDSEASSDEILGLAAEIEVFWEGKSSSLNLLVSLLDLLRLERWSAIEHRVENDTDGPDIALVGVSVAGLLVEDFGSKVVWSAANCALFLSLVKDLSCKSEISNLETHSLSEEEIAKLEISVDDLAGMDVLHTEHKLVDVVASLDLVEAFAALQKI